MKEIFEYLFFIGSSFVVWLKIISAALGFGFVVLSCYKFNSFLESIVPSPIQ